MEGMDTPWVELRTCAWLHEAHFIRSVLEGAGIEAFIPDEHTVGVHPGLTPAIGGVRVLVRPEDAEAAREVLASVSDHPNGFDDPPGR